MENNYFFQDEYAFIEVPYKHKIIPIKIDKEDFHIANSMQYKWVIRSHDEKSFYIASNKDHTIFLHRLILNIQSPKSKVYFLDQDHTNLSKSNLSINSYKESEKRIENQRKGFKKISEQGLQNIIKGQRENRYSKEWSDKLSITQSGTNNVGAILNEELVYKIREQYATQEISQKALADLYHVSRTTVADIINYRTWNQLGEDQTKSYRIFNLTNLYELNLSDSHLTYLNFIPNHIQQNELTLKITHNHKTTYYFIQKIGDIKIYVELRDETKTFIQSFEVVFPEIVNYKNIHNYIIAQRKPRKLNRKEIDNTMSIISTFIKKHHI